jgi:hypothetical protein
MAGLDPAIQRFKSRSTRDARRLDGRLKGGHGEKG